MWWNKWDEFFFYFNAVHKYHLEWISKDMVLTIQGQEDNGIYLYVSLPSRHLLPSSLAPHNRLPGNRAPNTHVIARIKRPDSLPGQEAQHYVLSYVSGKDVFLADR